MYQDLILLLIEGANNPNVTLTVLSGVGDYYTSGNDMGRRPNTDDLANKGM